VTHAFSGSKKGMSLNLKSWSIKYLLIIHFCWNQHYQL